jgi:hypothetical protein
MQASEPIYETYVDRSGRERQRKVAQTRMEGGRLIRFVNPPEGYCYVGRGRKEPRALICSACHASLSTDAQARFRSAAWPRTSSMNRVARVALERLECDLCKKPPKSTHT